MPGTLIGRIVVTPTQPRPAESVEVEVLDPAGQSLAGRTDVKVTLNGVPGALQYLQFAELRDHTLVAVASAGELSEREMTQFRVAGSSLRFNSTGLVRGEEDLPLMHLTQSETNPYAATFSLGRGFRAGALVARSRRPRDLAGRSTAGVTRSSESGAVADAHRASAAATKLEAPGVVGH